MKKIVAQAQKEWLKHPDNVVSFSHTFSQSDANVVTNDLNRKVIPAGTIYPANDGTAIGIVYTEVDVTDNTSVAGSLMVHGDVVEKKLPQTITSQAKASLEAKGIYFYADNGEALV